jgi:putative Holliday junction resolvase
MISEHTKDFYLLLPPKGRLLGLDMGQRKIGIALSDVERMIASPHSTYLLQNMNKYLGTLKRIEKDMGVIGFVIGLTIRIQ